MRYCNIFNHEQIGRITLKQYGLMMEAAKLQQTDKHRDIHALAWLTMQAKATKQRGDKTVPYFKSFEDFYKEPNERGKKSPKDTQELESIKHLVLKANSENSAQ